MSRFSYVRPGSLRDAIAVLDEHGPAARVLAGGTDVLVRLRLGHMRPSVVVDVKAVADLPNDIVVDGDVIRIGARAVMTDVIDHVDVRRHLPALVDAAAVVGSVQIRNRATVAGNICNASPAADTAPALLAYGARVTLAGRAGIRVVPLAEFFTGPGKTVMAPGELVTSVELPIPAAPCGAAFGRVTRRHGVDLATINMCCVVTPDDVVRFAYGAVAPRPFLVTDETGELARTDGDPDAWRAALDRLLGHARPISDVRGSQEYRRAMLDVVSRRSLAAALERRDQARKGGS